MAIDTADYPTAQTNAKAIHEKSQAVFSETETVLAKIGKRKPSVPKKKYGRLAVCLVIVHD